MFRQLREAALKVYRDRTLRNMALYYFVFSATPNSGTAFTYYLINEKKFSKSFMAIISVVSVLSGLAGLQFYKRFMIGLSTRTALRISILVSTLLGFVPLMLVTGFNQKIGIPDAYFALGDDVFESFAGYLSLIPMQRTVAILCPEGSEGIVYAGFMSLSNSGSALSSYTAAVLTEWLGITRTNYDNMYALVLLCTLTNLIPYVFTSFLPDASFARRKVKNAKGVTPSPPTSPAMSAVHAQV